MVINVRCSHCSASITVRNDAIPQNGCVLKVRCPGCKNILKIKVFSNGSYGEIVKGDD